jgi:Flp pilus assembly pilin Flp
VAVTLRNLWNEEDGQDLVEYSLLITFLALACAALFNAGRPAINGIWAINNNHLANAQAVLGGS